MNPIVYLPVEIQAREFESKALLAALLAERGYPVVLGQQWMLYANLDRLPPGVFLSKSFNKFHQPAMLQAKRAGHRVVALEEEMLAQVEEKAVVHLCNAGIFEIADTILCHGAFEHDLMRRLSGGKVRAEITGNSRVDLLKPALRAYFHKPIDEIRQRYGDLVLVNTNFATLNSIWGSVERATEIQIQGGFHDRNDPASMGLWYDYVASEKANQAGILTAVGELARRRPSQSVVVRPHPGEDLRRWEGMFREHPNVRVVREGSHMPWTMACRVLLHTSCTTGFEAYAAGTPALSLVPRPGWMADCLLSNRVNPTFADPLELVEATERILDGGTMPSVPPSRCAPQHYVWNLGPNDAARRIVDLLTEALPAAKPMSLPPLKNPARDPALKVKMSISAEDCADVLQRISEAAGIKRKPRVEALGDSLFVVTSAPGHRVAISPPQPDPAQLRAAMEGACQDGKFQQAYDLFRQNIAEAHRHGELCFLAGIALFELGKHALALQYFQSAAVAANALDWNLAYWQARTHQRLGELELARGYAEQAYRQNPMQQGLFDLFKELALRTGKEAPEHWMVIGCSQARCLRYLQLNPARFFNGAVHLDCYEFPEATAYGIGSPASEAGVLNATRQLGARIAQVDRVLVSFGEVDCRQAAWTAAAASGRPVEEMIGESADRVEAYVAHEILPRNKSVLLIGARPQITADAERERITLLFNAKLRQAAERLKIDYTDINHVLAEDKSRRQFFKRASWDGSMADTHGNVDYLATLYFQRLQEFI